MDVGGGWLVSVGCGSSGGERVPPLLVHSPADSWPSAAGPYPSPLTQPPRREPVVTCKVSVLWCRPPCPLPNAVHHAYVHQVGTQDLHGSEV